MVEEIQRDEQFWQAVWDGLSSHIAILDDQGVIVAVNRAWRTFALENGLAAEQCGAGIDYPRICESATGPWAEEAIPFARGLRGVLGGELSRFELEYPCHSPERERWFIARVTPLPDPRWRGVLVAHEDITQRKQAEEATRASERLFGGLFEHALSGVALHQVVTDAAGTPVDYVFLRVNPAFEAHTGLSAAAVLGRRVTEVLPGDEMAPFIKTFGRVALTGSPARFETWVEALGRHFQIEAYSPAHGQFATVFTDITERQRAEVERERLARALERKNRELESLVYATSHDLRSPLLNVQGFSRRIENLCRELQNQLPAVEPAGLRESLVSISGEQMQKSLRFILAGVDKMDRLINGLLRLSRLGREGMQLEPLNLDALWRDILAVHAFAIQSAKAVITVAPLPPCLGDATLVNQLFSNLLDNALKYRDPARPLRVSVTGRVEGKRAVYCVADNGVGIAPEQQDRIWEVFHRVRPEDTVSGEGLGLSLVRRVAERHQGDAWVESTPGEGSRFFVALPHSSA